MNNELWFNKPPGGGGGGGYQIQRGLRFNSADSSFLSRTPISSGNRKTWTWAGWVKRSVVSSYQVPVSTGVVGSTPRTYFRFDNTDNIRLQNDSGFLYVTTAVYRDPSAWMHVVWAVDTTLGTAADRVKLYINGVQVTSFSTATTAILNEDTLFNSTSHTGYLGVENRSTYYFNGYLADVHFIDGQALDPTSFGLFDNNGVWQPKAYTGSYGTNGYHLPFNDNSTAAALGTDTSGNGNTWTVNNISVAAGLGNDSLVDTPTNYGEDTGLGGEVRGNYATLNPLARTPVGGTFYTPTNGNLEVNLVATSQSQSTFAPSSGKWYAEFVMVSGTIGTDTRIGIQPPSEDAYVGNGATSYAYRSNGNIINGVTGNLSYGSTWDVGDVIGCALDLDNDKIWWSKNGTWQASGDPAAGANAAFTGLSGSYYFAILNGNSATYNKTFVCNFGQRPFAYTAPSGFKALCTANLPAPVVTKPSTVMDVKLYTGNGSTQTISGLEFSPDLVWIKNRAQADNHKLLDTARGATEELESNTTDAEVTNADGLTAFNSDGFDLGADVEYNTSTEAYVAWTWDAGSSTVTNTDGSISSQVRANASAGFSICTFTFNSTGTVGHGLGVAPEFIIVKARGNAAHWFVYHKSLGTSKYIRLSLTNEAVTFTDAWSPVNSTVFQMEAGLHTLDTYVAYCFAPVESYSAFGSYTGNGSADGPFVYTGFRPRWVMWKSSSTGGAVNYDWIIQDSARMDRNVIQTTRLSANTANSESSDVYVPIDFLSNGFKMRGTGAEGNANTQTYIYAAFAENPFKYARAR